MIRLMGVIRFLFLCILIMDVDFNALIRCTAWAEKGKCRNVKIQKYIVQIEKWKAEKKKRKKIVFKTQHLRTQKQIVIILKTFTYSIYILIQYWIEIKMSNMHICKRFKNNLFLVSQMQCFRRCIFSTFQLSIFLFLLCIFAFPISVPFSELCLHISIHELFC